MSRFGKYDHCTLGTVSQTVGGASLGDYPIYRMDSRYQVNSEEKEMESSWITGLGTEIGEQSKRGVGGMLEMQNP